MPSLYGKRHSRLSLPRVNHDPRPPNEKRRHGRSPFSQRDLRGPLPDGPSRLQRQARNQTSNQQPTPSAPRNQQGFSSYTPQGAAPDPRDDRYWADLAKMMFNKNQQLSQLNTQEIFGRTDYDTQMEELGRQQPRDELSLYENANRGGAFYSTATSEAAGRLQQAYEQQRAGLGQGLERENALREIARSAIEQGYTLDEAALLAESIDRQVAGELDRPAPPAPNQRTNWGGKPSNVNERALRRKLRRMDRRRGR